MKRSILLWRALAIALLAFAFGMAAYRAKVQPIAHDEALEYEWFLDGGVSHVLAYNPANHVLFTLLAKPIVWTLGVSEFTLRAPSLFGAAIYLIAIYLLCRRLFGDGILLLLSVAMLSLNPQILDFMPAARGYSLGLGFLAAADLVRRRGGGASLLKEPRAGSGNSVDRRLRSGMGQRKKQCKGCVQKALFFWTCRFRGCRSWDKGKTCSRSSWPTSPVLAGG